jgi:hypothetical protein
MKPQMQKLYLFKEIILNLGCIFQLLEVFVYRPQSCPIKPQSLRKEPNLHIFNASQVIQHAAEIENQLSILPTQSAV